MADKHLARDAGQRGGDAVFAVAALNLTFFHIVGGSQAKQQAEFFSAGFEQGGFIPAAGDAAKVLTLFHGSGHDLLDERDVGEHLLDGQRGGGAGFGDGNGAIVGLRGNDLSGSHELLSFC